MTLNSDTMPIGLELVRTTPTFTETTVPAALLASHKTAKGVWGRLLVHSGELNFTFEDQLDQVHHLTTGGHVDIAPQRPHHLTVGGPSTFAVEFYRLASEASQPD